MLGKSQLKYIQSLGQKKQRDEEAVFIVEGPKILSEWLNLASVRIRTIFALNEWAGMNNTHGIETILVTENELAKISQLHTPNQVLAVVEKWDAPRFSRANGLLLALDTIQDPGNLGTILRTADWFGLQQVVCNKDCADMYNPKVVQSAMGSLARINVLYTELAEWLDSQAAAVYATALEGQDVTTMAPVKEGIIVIGNESRGISPEVFQRISTRITIPGRGGAESLNAAVATGIVLSHLAAQ